MCRKDIVNIANILDSSGFIREANVLDRIAKRIKVAGFFGNDDGERGGFFGGRNRSNDREESLSATHPPSVAQLKNYIISQCKGDAYEIFLWSEGKSIVNNPPKEIRNIIMGMNPKITGSNYLIENIDAVNYFKSWVVMRTLGDEAFEYILDNNEEYLKLYRDFGRPTQKHNVQIIKKLETEGYASDNFEALEKAEDEFEKGNGFGGSGGRRR
jgi:hypothetical protein